MKCRLLPILLATLALSTGPYAFAAKESGEAPAQIAMEELATRLNLTPDQQAQIAHALEERNNRLKTMKGDLDASGSGCQKLKALREARSIQQEFVSKVSPVLTKDQQAEWDELRRRRATGSRGAENHDEPCGTDYLLQLARIGCLRPSVASLPRSQRRRSSNSRPPGS